MKRYLVVFLFLINSLVGLAQKVIYSRPVRINIPAKKLVQDSINNQPEKVSIKSTRTDFVEFADTMTYNNIKTEINLQIDTILVDSISFQQLDFKFNPIIIGSENEIHDFLSGEYSLNSSSISKSLANVVKETIEKEILPYIDSSNNILIKIKGTADAIETKGIKYKSEFGDKINEKCFFQDKIISIDINSKNLIKINVELAFLRTYAIRYFLENNFSELQQNNCYFEHYVEVLEGVGGNYRKVIVEIIVKRRI